MAEKTEGHNTKAVSARAAKKAGGSEKAETINFDFIKSNQFRVVHADGAHGGVTPNAQFIQIAFFSERSPIPKRETFKIDAGRLGEKIKKEQRDAVVREVEVEVLMNIQTAKSVCKWMEEKIKDLEDIQKELPKS